MKKVGIFILFCFLIQSCIPLRIAPNIEDYKVTKGKKFKRSLPKREMFVFEDSKDANHFYDYANKKFLLDHQNVYDNIPFSTAGQQYFFSFYEVEIPNKAINLFPVFFDVFLNAALGNEDMEPYLSEDSETILRKGNWYIAIEVYNDYEKDCLHKNSLSRTSILNYLRDLKKEYLSTHNYNEVVFKN